MKITMCFKHLEASNIMSCDTESQLSDFKLDRMLFQFMSYKIFKKKSTKNSRKLEFDCTGNEQIFFTIIFLYIMTRFYL